MASQFNPYAEWFGLNTSTKPTYYELLGLPNFENEPPVIAEAAELRLQLLEPHRSGPNADVAERLVREVTGVTNLLLSPDKRRQYEEQLRQQSAIAAAPPAAAMEAALPPMVDAADSPTAILPPGSFTLPPPAAPADAMPGANPYGAYPGYGTPMPAAAPGYAAPPGYGAVAGMAPPVMPPAGMPQSPAPQFAAAAPGYAPAAAPYGAPPSAPMGYAPNYAAAAQPTAYAAPAAAAPATATGATYTSSNVSQRTRLAGARKQKSSQTMMATAIIGGAGAILGIVMLAVAASSKPKTPVETTRVTAKKPNAMPQDVALSQAERIAMSIPQLPAFEQGEDPGYTYRSTPDEVLRNEARMRDFPSGTPAGFPSMPNLVQSMAPAGVTPSIATPAPMPMASATGTPNIFTPPPTTPTPPVPSATPSATAMPAPAPAAPVIAGLPPTEIAMEAALPADAAREKSVTTMLGAARRMLKARDYAKAEEVILQTQVLADVPALITSTYEHGRVVEHLRVFWNSVREAVKALNEGDELTFNGKTVKVVKHDDLNLVVKQDNKDVVLQIDKFLPGLAVMLAERGLSPNDPASKLAVACFLALDQGGDKSKALLLLTELGASGTDVTALKAVLEAP